MERLCEKLIDILNEQDFCFDPEEWRILRTALARFKAYEETGLEPDEIMDSIWWMSPVCVLCDGKTSDGVRTEKCGYPDDITKCLEQSKHLRELIQAEKDGRLVVLPCKKGDPLFVLTWDSLSGIEETKCRNISIINREDGPCANVTVRCMYDDWGGAVREFFPEEFGKTVFLTRAEAEAALEGGDE